MPAEERVVNTMAKDAEKMTALEAISVAQWIAFAPYIFQSSVELRDSGILAFVETSRNNGVSIEDIIAHTNMSHYAVRVLLEAGLGIKLVDRNEDKYTLTKLGHFFLNDKMTRVNTDFMRDVCYDGAQDLKSSLAAGKPKGLRHLGNWETIYEGLSKLPQKASESWFAFDHFYSDVSFPEALPIVFADPRKKLLDIGSNTGKWTLQCLQYDPDVQLGLVDLPQQLEMAKKNIDRARLANRVNYHPGNILVAENKLPQGYDTMWMSQFLDCFADEEIVMILKKCHEALTDDGSIFINETFWDRQRFKASSFSLQMTSLYFTTMANGNSQMYDSKVFFELIERAGFRIAKINDNVGLGHTILQLTKA